MNNIITTKIGEDTLYLKRDMLGYRIVEPYKLNDKINWLNLLVGGKRNAVGLLFMLLLLAFLMYSYNQDMKAIEDNYKAITADPIEWCKYVNNMKINYPTLNITFNISEG
jgi:hypothetical protein